MARLIASGMVITLEMLTMGNPQPSSYVLVDMEKVQRLDGSG